MLYLNHVLRPTPEAMTLWCSNIGFSRQACIFRRREAASFSVPESLRDAASAESLPLALAVPLHGVRFRGKFIEDSQEVSALAFE